MKLTRIALLIGCCLLGGCHPLALDQSADLGMSPFEIAKALERCPSELTLRDGDHAAVVLSTMLAISHSDMDSIRKGIEIYQQRNPKSVDAYFVVPVLLRLIFECPKGTTKDWTTARYYERIDGMEITDETVFEMSCPFEIGADGVVRIPWRLTVFSGGMPTENRSLEMFDQFRRERAVRKIDYTVQASEIKSKR